MNEDRYLSILYSPIELSFSNEMTSNTKRLDATDAKLAEVTRQRNDSERVREQLKVEVAHLNDTVATLRHDLVIQKNRMQNVQQDLKDALKKSIEKDQKIHLLDRLTNDLQLETNDLNKNIESLDGKMIYIIETCMRCRPTYSLHQACSARQHGIQVS